MRLSPAALAIRVSSAIAHDSSQHVDAHRLRHDRGSHAGHRQPGRRADRQRSTSAEGQHVAAGDLIAEMDTALLDAEIAQAQAAHAVAEAQVAQLQGRARARQIWLWRRPAWRQAEAGRDAAYTMLAGCRWR